MPAKSERQRRLFGMVVRCKKTGECASQGVEKIAKGISLADAEDFARKPIKEEYSFKFFVEKKLQSECGCDCSACKLGRCSDCTKKPCPCKGTKT